MIGDNRKREGVIPVLLDPVAFLVGFSVSQLISLLVVTGSIKIGEAKALRQEIRDLMAPQKKRRISKPK